MLTAIMASVLLCSQKSVGLGTKSSLKAQSNVVSKPDASKTKQEMSFFVPTINSDPYKPKSDKINQVSILDFIKPKVATKPATKPKEAPKGRKITVVATAYDTSPAQNGGYTVTATGKPLKRGMIAVDPKVIPLGSIVHIPGYGEGWATDTGGAIKGRRIDVCHASRSWCNRFGRRKVEITIIGYKSPFKSKKK